MGTNARKKASSISSSSGAKKSGIPGLFNLVLFASGVISLFGLSSVSWIMVMGDSGVRKINTVTLVKEYPHDREAFTQGLLFAGNDTFFESTGLNGRSSVRRVNLPSGKVELITTMNKTYFGEGLTLVDQRLYQVTWLTKTGFIYDRTNLTQLGSFTHNMQDGWGLATDGKVLFGSDGTAILYQLDISTFKVIRRNRVRYGGKDVRYLNELEYINGEVWANVWQTDCIVRISPSNGAVVGWILLPQLRRNLEASGENAIDVLNGIAWDANQKRIFVTGKLWPKVYEVKLSTPARNMNSAYIKKNCLP